MRRGRPKSGLERKGVEQACGAFKEATLTTSTRTFGDTLIDAHIREKEMRPVDRRASLDHFMFRPPTAENESAVLRPMQPDGDGEIVGAEEIALDALAYGQLLNRVNYPKRLAEKLPGGMVHASVNYLMQFELEDRHALLRLVEGGTKARAVLGSRYTPFDNAMLFDLVAEYVKADSIVRYEGTGDTSTHLTLTFPASSMAEAGEGLLRGIHIANSEVGGRAIVIQGVIYRETCTNVLPIFMRGRADIKDGYANGDHYIRKSLGDHDLRGALKGAVKAEWRFIHQGNGDALEAFVRDAIEDTTNQYEGAMARWQAGLRHEIDHPLDEIEAIAKAGKLTKEQLKASLEGFAIEHQYLGNTLTAVANAFTRAAQDEKDPEERYFMQAVGAHTLMSLN